MYLEEISVGIYHRRQVSRACEDFCLNSLVFESLFNSWYLHTSSVKAKQTLSQLPDVPCKAAFVVFTELAENSAQSRTGLSKGWRICNLWSLLMQEVKSKIGV